MADEIDVNVNPSSAQRISLRKNPAGLRKARRHVSKNKLMVSVHKHLPETSTSCFARTVSLCRKESMHNLGWAGRCLGHDWFLAKSQIRPWEPTTCWLDAMSHCYSRPACCDPPLRLWGNYRIDHIPRATLFSGSRESKVVNTRT
jgi:hypothetical protein